jgi:hypothetical protein
MGEACGPAIVGGLGATERKDVWWTEPLVTGLVLGAFIVYATFRGIYNDEYRVGPNTGRLEDHAYLLSPLYSPLIIWDDMPPWLSPALFILWGPAGFRLTCYYYRKAYYRAYFLDPVACAVNEPHRVLGVFARGHGYKGETRLFVFQNLHRYFMYVAVVFLFFLTWDVIESCVWPNDGFGISVGTVILAANTALLTLYTLSCHSLRHLVGGCLDCFSGSRFSDTRYRLWACASSLNRRHMLWAWTSLIVVGFADFYVWMVASGVFIDVRLL